MVEYLEPAGDTGVRWGGVGWGGVGWGGVGWGGVGVNLESIRSQSGGVDPGREGCGAVVVGGPCGRAREM